MSNTPKVRIAGFTGDWEQRKLGEMVQFSKGTGYSKGDLKESGTPIILYGRLYTKYETVITDVDTFADEKTGSVYSRGGEVIVPASGETAEDISIASVVEKSGVLLGGDLNIITPPAELDSAFLAISISNGKPHNDMAKMAQGKSVVHLHNTDLEKIDLAYPSHEEQMQISGFFKSLDNLITLQQREYEKLVSLKSACLDKMFPKNGSKVPELRFAGFTGNWEQRKLCDCCSQLSATLNPQDTPDDVFTEYSMPAFDNGEVPDIVAGITMNSARKILDRPCLLINKLNVRKRRIWIVEKPEENAVSSAEFVPVYSDEVNLGFLKYIVSSDSYTAYLEDCSSGSSNSQKRVTPDVIMSATFLFPSKGEQDRIGEFLTKLDNLITLQQRKLEKLKQLKQSMLYSMFV